METFIQEYAWLIVLAALWQTVWTGYGLWLSARADRWKWFIAMLLINTLGILEIIYILLFDTSEDNIFRK